jgi:hypothetical protein
MASGFDGDQPFSVKSGGSAMGSHGGALQKL